MKTTRYVAGFMFNNSCEGVVLIRKTNPTWQRGFFNGVGGKIESGETPQEAMAREFREETGVDTPPDVWTLFATLSGFDWVVEFFCGRGFESDVKTMTCEEIVFADAGCLPGNVISNLRWLIPMAVERLNNRGDDYHDIKIV